MPNGILGISAFYHDSAAAMLVDGEIVAAAHEERFSRKKHDSSFPRLAARYVLDEAGLAVSDISCMAFYDRPFLKFERLLETYHAFAPSEVARSERHWPRGISPRATRASPRRRRTR